MPNRGLALRTQSTKCNMQRPAATLQDVCAADVQALFNSNDCTEPVSAPLTKEQLRRMEVKRIATAVGDMLFPGLFLKMQMIRMYYQFMEAQGTPRFAAAPLTVALNARIGVSQPSRRR
jgi:hypothetical protein